MVSSAEVPLCSLEISNRNSRASPIWTSQGKDMVMETLELGAWLYSFIHMSVTASVRAWACHPLTLLPMSWMICPVKSMHWWAKIQLLFFWLLMLSQSACVFEWEVLVYIFLQKDSKTRVRGSEEICVSPSDSDRQHLLNFLQQRSNSFSNSQHAKMRRESGGSSRARYESGGSARVRCESVGSHHRLRSDSFGSGDLSLSPPESPNRHNSEVIQG